MLGPRGPTEITHIFRAVTGKWILPVRQANVIHLWCPIFDSSEKDLLEKCQCFVHSSLAKVPKGRDTICVWNGECFQGLRSGLWKVGRK